MKSKSLWYFLRIRYLHYGWMYVYKGNDLLNKMKMICLYHQRGLVEKNNLILYVKMFPPLGLIWLSWLLGLDWLQFLSLPCAKVMMTWQTWG